MVLCLINGGVQANDNALSDSDDQANGTLSVTIKLTTLCLIDSDDEANDDALCDKLKSGSRQKAM